MDDSISNNSDKRLSAPERNQLVTLGDLAAFKIDLLYNIKNVCSNFIVQAILNDGCGRARSGKCWEFQRARFKRLGSMVSSLSQKWAPSGFTKRKTLPES